MLVLGGLKSPRRPERARPALAGALIAAATIAQGVPDLARADDSPIFRFSGTVEPLQSVTVASHLDGIVDAVLFTPGQTVAAGDPLFRIEPEEFEIAVAAARADLDEARALFELAVDTAERQAQLRDSGSGSRVRALEADVGRRVAAARLAAAEAALATAELALERTEINAPIGGQVGWPLVARGAFVEAEAGTAMAEIVQTDPVLVAYGVPPEVRAAALDASGADSVAGMFERLTVVIVLPTGAAHPEPGRPRFDSAEIDAETGMLTTWAEVPNPSGTLVPGLPVEVVSRLQRSER